MIEERKIELKPGSHMRSGPKRMSNVCQNVYSSVISSLCVGIRSLSVAFAFVVSCYSSVYAVMRSSERIVYRADKYLIFTNA